LGNRVFLMHNVHEDAPVTFETRWTLSYLRGPLTRTHIKQLTQAQQTGTGNREPGSGYGVPGTNATVGRDAPPARPITSTQGGRLGEPSLPISREPATGDGPSGVQNTPPVLPPGVTAMFVPARGASGALAYEPALYAAGTVRLADQKRGITETRPVQVLVPLQTGASPLALDRVAETDTSPDDLESTPRGAASYGELPGAASTPRSYDKWRKDVATWLYDTQSLTVWSDPASGLVSTVGETEGAFRGRVAESRRSARDAQVDALRKKYAPKVATQQERIRKAEQQLGKQQQEVTSSTGTALLTAATGMFGALFGRKTFSAANAGRLGTAARGAGKVMKEKQDVTRAQETLAAEQQKLADLQAALEADAAALASAADAGDALQPLVIRPKKSDITVTTATLVWVPQ
ncbi:MAG TPA: hypothetical protein VMF13_22995, partial [Luteitalea sp.]|nr:hypothetical protein [Luteitalea sp.]